MLELSLMVSAILLVVANLSARRLGCAVAGMMVCGVGLLCLTALSSVFLWPVGIQFVLLAVIMMGWPEKSSRPWSFLTMSLSATAAAYAVAVGISLATDEPEFARLRARFPYESIAERLPAPHLPSTGEPLAEDTEAEMIRLEKAVQHKEGRDTMLGRAFLLRRLHEDRVSLFMDSSGFGVARLMGRPSERGITRPLDGFEASSLEKLRRGEYLLVAEAPEGVRMLGAIRSVKQCTNCHGGERGDLLGAFSYTLRRGER